MSIEEIRRAIIERANSEANEILRQAEEEANRIIREAEERKRQIIEEERKKIIESVKAEVKLSEAKLRARLIILAAKNEIVDAIKRYAWETINSLNVEKRRESLKNILRESMEELFSIVDKPWNIVIRVNERDIPLVSEIINSPEFATSFSNIGKIEAINISGGIVVSCCDDEIIIDNSYETRFEKALRTITPELLK